MTLRSLLLVALIGLLVAERAQAFDCPPVQPSSSRTPPYGPVAGQPRCEGFFQRTVSQPFVELVSLTRGPPLGWSSDPTSGTAAAPIELHVDAKGLFNLVVQPQRSNPFYRMDTAVVGQQILRWDPAPMIDATGLQARDLGFLAFEGTAGAAPPRLAPVALTSQTRGDKTATAVVRVSVDVDSIDWRSRSAYATSDSGAWRRLPGSQLFAWQRATLPIELPPEGKALAVDVQAVAKDSGRALPLLRFTIVGPNDASLGR